MSWNYRVVKDGSSFSIREVYYTKKGNPKAWSNPMSAWGENEKEVKYDLKLMREALKRPTLEIRGEKLKPYNPQTY